MKFLTSLEFLNILKSEIINKKHSFFLTGSAGVGKTTLLQNLKNELNAVGVNAVLTSTTGLSSFHIGGVTIHKFMGINIQKNVDYLNYFSHTFQFQALKKRLAKFDVIIIDEISMLRADSGDFLQIPPVVLENEIKKNQWIFTSDPWINGNIKIYKLVHVHRQSDNDFVRCLDEIKEGKVDSKKVKDLIKKCEKRKPTANDTVFFATNEECDKFNNDKIAKLPGEMITYVATVAGKRKQYNKDAIIRECIAKEKLDLKIGAKVIIIYNDPKNRFVNGTKATITKLKEHNIEVLIDNQTKPIILKRHTWKKLDYYNKTIAYMKQIPVIPAYGLTIHKSQGMTLDAIVIDCKNIFTYGQLYVGMSRVRDANNMTLINFDNSKVITSKTVKSYYKNTKMEEIYVE